VGHLLQRHLVYLEALARELLEEQDAPLEPREHTSAIPSRGRTVAHTPMKKAALIRPTLILAGPVALLVLAAAPRPGVASQPPAVVPAVPSGSQEPGRASPDASGWDRVFSNPQPIYRSEPNAFLASALERMQREQLLPGKAALDLAMGDGRNALLLAEQGLEVTGLDVSTVALEKARARAAERKLALHALEQDLFTYDYGQEKWDLITVIYFNPAVRIFDQLKSAVKPGGLIVIEGQGSEHTGDGPPPATRFRPNQLLQAFSDWRILAYEDGRFDCDWSQGAPTHVVRLMARKPAPGH
jgi:SAM-dependent methyltransferase